MNAFDRTSTYRQSSPLARLRNGLSMMQEARSQSGKSAFHQAAEILSLRKLRLGPTDYYRFRLFDDARLTREQKREYTGWRFQDSVYKLVNDPGLLAVSGVSGSWAGMIDKVLFDCLMRAGAVPTPVIIALFDRDGAEYFGLPSLRTDAELRTFFSERGASGFFAKPARAHSGTGVFSVERIEGERALLTDGTDASVTDLVEYMTAHHRVVLQERLAPHAIIEELSGPTVATLRIVALRRPEASQIHRTILRIPAGGNVIDNFDAGRTGNLVGWVEPDTGEVTRVFAGTGVTQHRIQTHPDTGTSFEGLVLPDWEEAKEILDRASRVLVGMPFQSWDLALTSRGPVMIEVNDVSSQGVLQLAGPPGLLDERLCAFLRECGLDWPYPHPG